jgi:hypothetical protein
VSLCFSLADAPERGTPFDRMSAARWIRRAEKSWLEAADEWKQLFREFAEDSGWECERNSIIGRYS